jgi:segregation and condensation protein B
MTTSDEPERQGGPPKLRLVSSDRQDPGSVVDDEAPASVATCEEPASESGRGGPDSVEQLYDRQQMLRVLEALLFSTAQSLSVSKLAEFLPPGEDPLPLLMELQERYEGGGVNLVRVAGKWAFRTAPDLGYLLKRETVDERRLSKAALETLAIIAYHQPVTRAEIEEIRGVSTSAGTLDILLETGWIRPRGRRRAPGRPLTYGTTDQFLEHFGIDSVRDLPGLGELRGAGLLSAQLPPDFSIPQPNDVAALMPDELPLEEDEEAQAGLDLDEETESEIEDEAKDEDAGLLPETAGPDKPEPPSH